MRQYSVTSKLDVYDVHFSNSVLKFLDNRFTYKNIFNISHDKTINRQDLPLHNFYCDYIALLVHVALLLKI